MVKSKQFLFINVNSLVALTSHLQWRAAGYQGYKIEVRATNEFILMPMQWIFTGNLDIHKFTIYHSICYTWITPFVINLSKLFETVYFAQNCRKNCHKPTYIFLPSNQILTHFLKLVSFCFINFSTLTFYNSFHLLQSKNFCSLYHIWISIWFC